MKLFYLIPFMLIACKPAPTCYNINLKGVKFIYSDFTRLEQSIYVPLIDDKEIQPIPFDNIFYENVLISKEYKIIHKFRSPELLLMQNSTDMQMDSLFIGNNKYCINNILNEKKDMVLFVRDVFFLKKKYLYFNLCSSEYGYCRNIILILEKNNTYKIYEICPNKTMYSNDKDYDYTKNYIK